MNIFECYDASKTYCLNCGSQFNPHPSRSSTYCSKKCFGIARILINTVSRLIKSNVAFAVNYVYVKYTCRNCNNIFEYIKPATVKKLKSVCDDCQQKHKRLINNRPYYKAQHSAYSKTDASKEQQRRYSKSDAGKYSRKNARKKYQNTDKYKVSFNKYRKSEKYKETHKRYLKTNSGQKISVSANKRRMELHFDYYLYVQNVKQMHAANPPCALCDIKYSPNFQCDHIIPLALLEKIPIRPDFNGDSQENLQALCPPCHRLKTNRDVKILNQFRKGEIRNHRKTLETILSESN